LPEKDNKDNKELRQRAFWFGTITFGLVSVPVALFPGNRRYQPSLRMLAQDGTPLKRRFFCSLEDSPVDRDEIIRGYEVAADKYVIVSDGELEALEPEKTKEINLSRFVPVEQIDPIYFDRSYFLAPAGDSQKPYQLLAETMERTGRAGIATFVMRGKEYLVAILAENGILRAETLRFEEEIRTPEGLGLSEMEKVADSKVKAVAAEIESAAEEELEETELQDYYADKLINLISKKRASGRDVIQAEPEDEELEEEEEGGKVIDLMEVLKRSMRQTRSGDRPAKKSPAASIKQPKGKVARDLRRKNKSELYDQAKKLGISGRSAMSKEELIRVLLRAEGERGMHATG
jgi:DNA end-binding protein Ku